VAISSAGIGSGLDINGIISQLMAVERRPLAALDQKEAKYQTKLSAYGALKGAMSSFQTAMRDLSTLSKFQAVKTTVADTAILSASASASANPGSYSIEVKQLAQSHKLASAGFANATDTVGSGTLTIQFGTWNGTTFTANADKATQSVTIASSQNTLTGIRDAVNAAKIGVTAAIVNDGTTSGNKLVFTSNDTGAANSLKITVADDDGNNTDNSGLSRLAYDPAGTSGNGKNLTETVAAQNATLKVDGIDNISKASNTVTDVVQGVTLTLLKTSAANTPTTLTVARDTGAVQTSVEAFVKAYNDLRKTVTDLTAYNADTKQASALQGDAAARSVLTQVRRTLSTALTGLSGAYTDLSQVGVSFKSDGTLSLDATKLQSALSSNFNDVAGVFAAFGKPSDSLIGYVSATDKTKPGRYEVSVTTLPAQGYYTGAATATLPLTIDANNDTFALKVNGVQTGTVTLTQGSYSTAAALTAEIQSRINGDSALKAAGVSVTVTHSSNRLTITSGQYGSASTVEITAVDTNTATTLGLSAGSGTAGVDAAGSIGGVSATGSGRYLTGAGDADGLKIEVTGGSTGARGGVYYSQGYAYRLDRLMTGLLDAKDGTIAGKTNGLNASIENIGGQRDALNRRLADVEKRLRAQFTALDSIVSQLRTTSDYLSRQLTNLPGAGSR
jgi:flagellar hook-associated protein 2